MDLIHQIMCQQIVPEGPAAGYQNIFALLSFEFGKLLICVATPDDSNILPVSSSVSETTMPLTDLPAWERSRCESVHSSEVGFSATLGQKLWNSSKETRPIRCTSAVRS